MELEAFIQKLIYVHAGFGGLALCTGGIAISVKKGSNLHKKSGKLFFYTMFTSAVLSLIIALMPQHESPFLIGIGLFSMYFLITGLRSLSFKKPDISLKTDKILAILLIATCLFMIVHPIIVRGKLNIVLLIFGIVGILFAISDLSDYLHPAKLRTRWLSLHLGKMTGGYISAVSAFFVVNQILPGIWNWFVPGIVGGFYIFFSIRKITKPRE